jgi:uncharacterized protein YdbL (DUF1318 family)
MKKFWIITLFLTALSFSTAAFALDLSEARTRGLVGEKLDGFIASVKQPTDEVNAVVSDINSRRRAEYEKISKNNGQPVSIVGKVAAENIINKLPAGSYFQSPNGDWVKK